MQLDVYFRKVTRLRIVLSELPENVIQEVVAYTWNQYLADIGGATSLILGSRLSRAQLELIWSKLEFVFESEMSPTINSLDQSL